LFDGDDLGGFLFDEQGGGSAEHRSDRQHDQGAEHDHDQDQRNDAPLAPPDRLPQLQQIDLIVVLFNGTRGEPTALEGLVLVFHAGCCSVMSRWVEAWESGFGPA